MNIISKQTLIEYGEANPRALQSLLSWHKDVLKSNWNTPEDVKAEFPKASIVANNRVVFNIAGNEFRLIVKVAYKWNTVYIKFIGTHQEYDKVDATTIDDTG